VPVVAAALIVLGGYLLGSAPFGYWIVRLFRHEDIRTKGSGNIGATNVWRVYGRWLGVPVILLDVAKGFIPAYVGVKVSGELVGVLAGAAAMAGHWRPLYLRFAKGGKTVATAGGVAFALAPVAAGCCVATWLVVFVLFRYSSLASIVTALALPVYIWAFGGDWPAITFGALAALAVLLLHKANIRRLLKGTENRFRLRGTARA
jgi:glycerol-3-phosphate acyltransferase PlsY